MVEFIFKVRQLLSHLSWSHPAGTWRQNGVGLTSMQRDDITQTSERRHFNVMRLQASTVVFVLQVL